MLIASLIAGTPLKVRVLDLGAPGAVLSSTTGVELEGTQPDGVAVGAQYDAHGAQYDAHGDHYSALHKRVSSHPRTADDVALLSEGGAASDFEISSAEISKGGDLEGGAAFDFEVSALEILPIRLRCAIEGETARLDAHLKLRRSLIAC
jgi:hypothetical protein